MTAESLDVMIASIGDLPTLPVVLEQVTRSVNDPSSSAKDIAKIIKADQALASRLLRVSNSAFYGMTRRVAVVDEAVALVGLNALMGLVAKASVMEVMGKYKDRLFDRRLFWMHAIGCGVGAKVLAAKAALPDPDVIFAAGLLHDVGKLVLDKWVHERFVEAIRLHAVGGLDFVVAETEALGYTHQDVGRALAHKWKLPDVLVAAIGRHHEPAAAGEHAAAASCVQVADAICHGLGLGDSLNQRLAPIERDAWTRLQLKPAEAGSLLPAIEGESEVLRRKIGL